MCIPLSNYVFYYIVQLLSNWLMPKLTVFSFISNSLLPFTRMEQSVSLPTLDASDKQKEKNCTCDGRKILVEANIERERERHGTLKGKDRSVRRTLTLFCTVLCHGILVGEGLWHYKMQIFMLVYLSNWIEVAWVELVCIC